MSINNELSRYTSWNVPTVQNDGNIRTEEKKLNFPYLASKPNFTVKINSGATQLFNLILNYIDTFICGVIINL